MSTFSLASATLPEWLGYLERMHPTAIEMGLERIRRVQAKLGLEPSFSIISVAGTNGKGSTCMMLEAILSHAGYCVGCYTSPHLLRYNERVRINRREAGDDELCEAFRAVESARMNSGVSLTYFEFGTLSAMYLFSQAAVEVAILEVGLGGRLDAVNVFDTDCAVLTSIDFDHMDYLGNTREQIGFEKAGIFRSGKAAICSELDLPVSVRRHAQSIGANLMHIGEHFDYSTAPQSWSYRWNGESRHALPYPALRGACQLKNASACLAALDSLKDTFPVTLSDIRYGLLEVVWPGRFQVLPGRPVTVLDVAHNPGAARAFAASLDSMERYPRTYAVFAMLRDKDIAGVARELRSRVDVWLVSGIDVPRGATADEVAAQVAQALQIAEPRAGDTSEVAVHTIRKFRNPSEAYAYACEQAARNDRICVFGSFHTVAEVLKNMVERR